VYLFCCYTIIYKDFWLFEECYLLSLCITNNIRTFVATLIIFIKLKPKTI